LDPYELIHQKIKSASTLEESAAYLEILFNEGYAVSSDGRLYSIKHKVADLEGLKIRINSNEHPPPHFHVITDNFNASFAIEDCSHIKGQISQKDIKLINCWYESSRNLLVKIWNETRPTNCTVGPIK
jgi:hypothetical protein